MIIIRISKCSETIGTQGVTKLNNKLSRSVSFKDTFVSLNCTLNYKSEIIFQNVLSIN